MAVTMADVARRAGTSTAVVSYVLNDGPRPVAAGTRERVLAAAEELGYRPNRMASGLRSGSSGLVGVVLPDTVNPYFATLGRHIENALEEAGKLTVLANSGYDIERQAAVIDRLLGAQVDGLIIVSADGASDPTTELRRVNTPVVAVHHRAAGSRAGFVAADNTGGVRSAVAHLAEHGHASLDFLGGPTEDGPVAERAAAWRGLADGELLRCGYSREAAAAMTIRLEAEGRLPPAMLVATDEQAIGVLSGAHAAGVDIPGDLALISCDGSPETAFTVPPMTVVEQPFAEMSKRAVVLLSGAPDTAEPPRARLVERRTCGCRHPAIADVADRQPSLT